MLMGQSRQGGLNKKEIQLNLYKIFSIFIFNDPNLVIYSPNNS